MRWGRTSRARVAAESKFLERSKIAICHRSLLARQRCIALISFEFYYVQGKNHFQIIPGTSRKGGVAKISSSKPTESDRKWQICNYSHPHISTDPEWFTDVCLLARILDWTVAKSVVDWILVYYWLLKDDWRLLKGTGRLGNPTEKLGGP